MVKINGKDYQVRTLSAGDLPALAPLAAQITPLVSDLKPGKLPDMTRLLPLAGDLIGVLARVTDCPVDVVESLPLHEFIRVLEDVASEWLILNADYLNEQVTPALNRLAESITGLQDEPAPEPAQPPPPKG